MKYKTFILTFVAGILFSFSAFAIDDGDLGWAKTMGAEGVDRANSVVADGSGSVYITGSFEDTVDFDPGPGVYNLSGGSNESMFVCKLDKDGNFIWAKSMRGAYWEVGNDIAIDDSGNIYTTGIFWDTVDFDPGPAVFNLTSFGKFDVFISKLDSDGNFIWAKSMGGPDSEYGNAISVDDSGNVYTNGTFLDTVDFDPGPAVFNLTSTGDSDIFISKLDSDGNFIWAKSVGGLDFENGNDISVDDSGNVYTTGIFWDAVDFDPGPAVFNLTSTGSSDIFISKLDSDGNFIWAKSVGGVSRESVSSITVDGSGNIYSTGTFQDTADFDPDPAIFNLTSTGDIDIFISKLDSNGNFIWAKSMGGPESENGNDISVDDSGNVYTTGTFRDTVDFDPGAGIFSQSTAGFTDSFISKLDSNGNFIWAKVIGGTSYDMGHGLSVDDSGNVYAVGMFSDTADFDPGEEVVNLKSKGSRDIFVVKLSGPHHFPWAMFMPAIIGNGLPE